jgi:hypothetical protein
LVTAWILIHLVRRFYLPEFRSTALGVLLAVAGLLAERLLGISAEPVKRFFVGPLLEEALKAQSVFFLGQRVSKDRVVSTYLVFGLLETMLKWSDLWSAPDLRNIIAGALIGVGGAVLHTISGVVFWNVYHRGGAGPKGLITGIIAATIIHIFFNVVGRFLVDSLEGVSSTYGLPILLVWAAAWLLILHFIQKDRGATRHVEQQELGNV